MKAKRNLSQISIFKLKLKRDGNFIHPYGQNESVLVGNEF